MCCPATSLSPSARRRSAQTGTSRSLLSLARAPTPPLEDRTVTVPRSDDYESDTDELGEYNYDENDDVDMDELTDSDSTSDSTSTSTSPTPFEIQLDALMRKHDALYNELQVATIIGIDQMISIADTISITETNSIKISSLLVQIGTLHLNAGHADLAANSFLSAVNFLEKTGRPTQTTAISQTADEAQDEKKQQAQLRLCVETTALKSLGHIYFKQNMYQEAMTYFVRAHGKSANGGEEILTDVNLLLAAASKHRASAEYHPALDALLAASHGIEVAHGRCHDLFVNVLMEAASIFRLAGEKEAAAAVFRQVLFIGQQQTIGSSRRSFKIP